jgi:hypothetical protein
MAHLDEINYCLPISVAHASGTVTITKDTVLDRAESAPQATMVLDVIGESPAQTARIESGWLRDTGVAFELTDDGRLTSSAVESTGQGGKAVLAVAGVGAFVGGLALGLPPGALIAAAGAVVGKAADLPNLEKAFGRTHAELAAEQTSDEQRIEEAYQKAHPRVLSLSKEYASLALELNLKLAAAARELVEAESTDVRPLALWKLRTYGQALAAVQAELDRLKQHFNAWRAGTFTTRTETHVYLLPVDLIRAADVTVAEDGTLTFPESPAAKKVEHVWDKLGLIVRVAAAGKDKATNLPRTGDNELLFRIPRRVRLEVYERKEGKALLLESKEHLIMDGLSAVKTIKLRKSMWAKRSSTLKFSSTGALIGYASTATAAGAAFAETAQGIPAALASSVEQSKTMYEQIDALRSRSLEQRLARVKKEVELKQQEVARDDLLATAGEHAELERLKQEAAILEQRDKIAGFASPSVNEVEIANLKQQVELLTAKHDLAVPRRALASEAELGDIWREIESLSARQELDDVRRDERGNSH